MAKKINQVLSGEKEQVNKGRIKEITEVLMKHKITEGLTPEKLRLLLEDLGPTYVKMGQIMSMRSDMLPTEYCEELTKLRSNVAPLDLETVKKAIETELGKPISEMFESFDEKPLGSASIAQAHRAVLKTGEDVVIKVQRPGIYEKMKDDVEILRKAAKLMEITAGIEKEDFNSMLDEMWDATKVEMDFYHEAGNLNRFRKNQEGVPYVVSPVVYTQYSNKRILTMTNMKGDQIDHVDDLRAQGLDVHDLAQKMAENYVKQVVSDRFFHADPHPGNIRVSGGKIGWIDMGTMGELSKGLAKGILDLIQAIVLQDPDEVVEVVLTVFTPRGEVDKVAFTKSIQRVLKRYMSEDFGSIDIGLLIEELTDVCKDSNFAIPNGLTTLGKSLITIEGTILAVDPTVNLMEILSAYIKQYAVKDERTPEQRVQEAAMKFAGSVKRGLEAPGNMASVIKLLKDGDLKLRLEMADSDKTVTQKQERADDQTIATLVLAFFTLTGLMAGKESKHKVMGLPWQAFLSFTAGFAMAVGLVIKYAKRYIDL